MQPPLEGEYVEVHNAADEGNFDNDDEIGPLNVSGTSTGFVQTRELDIEIRNKKSFLFMAHVYTASFKDMNYKFDARGKNFQKSSIKIVST